MSAVEFSECESVVWVTDLREQLPDVVSTAEFSECESVVREQLLDAM